MCYVRLEESDSLMSEMVLCLNLQFQVKHNLLGFPPLPLLLPLFYIPQRVVHLNHLSRSD